MFGRDDTDRKPQLLTNRQRLARNDEMRFAIAGWPISANKIHALKYGTMAVFIGGVGAFHPVASFSVSALIFLFAFWMWALPDWAVRMDEPEYRGPPIGVLTIRYKPHYFTFSYLLWYVFGFGLAEVFVV